MVFFFQAEDGIRDLVRSRGLGDVYKRQQKVLGFDVEGTDESLKSLPVEGYKKMVERVVKTLSLIHI